MANYEVGSEITKITEKILAEMVVKTEFEKEVHKTINQRISIESVESLFQFHLKKANKKE